MFAVRVEVGDSSRVNCVVRVACGNMIVEDCPDVCLVGSLVGVLVSVGNSLDPTLASLDHVARVVSVAGILEPCLGWTRARIKIWGRCWAFAVDLS